MAVIISHALIFDKNGRFLVLCRSKKEKVLPEYWDLPGGTVRLREDPMVAAIRETKEECGLEIFDLELFTHISTWDSVKKEKFVTLFFKAEKYSGNIKLNQNDHQEYSWVSKNEIRKIRTVKYFKKILNYIN